MGKLENGGLTKDHLVKSLLPGTFLYHLMEFHKVWYVFTLLMLNWLASDSDSLTCEKVLIFFIDYCL